MRHHQKIHFEILRFRKIKIHTEASRTESSRHKFQKLILFLSSRFFGISALEETKFTEEITKFSSFF